jgi:eukaryotic-like serine/threonine-protein kinase
MSETRKAGGSHDGNSNGGEGNGEGNAEARDASDDSDDVSGELPPTPARLDKYQVVRLIGGGGGGVVYEAVHPELKRRVAVKVLHPSLTDSPAAVRRFLREGQAAARIDHPHVVEVADVGLHQGQPFLVMELLAGCDLKAYLARRGPLTLVETLDLMLPVISAVSAAHEAGVIHRDLKPLNVFVATGRGGRMHPKVLDFGVAKLIDETRGRTSWTGGEVVMGTLSYMAPEQARGGPLDARVDQYALALIIHECLTGKRVHDGKDQVSIVEKIVHGDIAPPGAVVPGLPPAFEEALMRALSRDADARFASAHQLGCALLPFAGQRMRTIWNMVFEPRRSTRLLAANAGAPTPVELRAPALQASTVPMRAVGRPPAEGGADEWAFAQETRRPRKRAPGWLVTATTLAVVAVAGVAAVSLQLGVGPAARVRARPAKVIADTARLSPAAAAPPPARRPPEAAILIIPPERPQTTDPRDTTDTTDTTALAPPRAPAPEPPAAPRARKPRPRIGHDRRPPPPPPARGPGYRLGANQSPIITD